MINPGRGRKLVAFTRRRSIFVQGDPADAVFHIKRGTVGLNIVSSAGKRATIGILNAGDFFGESCLTEQPLRLCSATAMTDCLVMRMEKNAVVEVLRREPEFGAMLVACLLARNLRYQADLADQLLNSSEKRLARILLSLAHFDKGAEVATVVPMMNHETLASMVGTTRSRVGFFLKKFKALGFVTYDGRNRLQVHSSRAHLVLDD